MYKKRLSEQQNIRRNQPGKLSRMIIWSTFWNSCNILPCLPVTFMQWQFFFWRMNCSLLIFLDSFFFLLFFCGFSRADCMWENYFAKFYYFVMSRLAVQHFSHPRKNLFFKSFFNWTRWISKKKFRTALMRVAQCNVAIFALKHVTWIFVATFFFRCLHNFFWFRNLRNHEKFCDFFIIFRKIVFRLVSFRRKMPIFQTAEIYSAWKTRVTWKFRRRARMFNKFSGIAFKVAFQTALEEISLHFPHKQKQKMGLQWISFMVCLTDISCVWELVNALKETTF